MKLPGGTEVKNKNLVIGGSVAGIFILYILWKRKKAAAAATSASAGDGSGVDPNSIDPATGIPFGEETGYGGYYMGTTVPDPYVSNTGSPTVNGSAGYTSNVAWEGDAIQYATGYFNASPVLAGSATAKYLAQSKGGLNSDEYALMSELIGLIGAPPQGSFKLIQAMPSQNPSGTPTPVPAPVPTGDPNEHYVADGHTSLNGVASMFHSSTTKIIAATMPSQPADVTAYLASSKGDYSRALRAGTKWNIPKS